MKCYFKLYAILFPLLFTQTDTLMAQKRTGTEKKCLERGPGVNNDEYVCYNSVKSIIK